MRRLFAAIAFVLIAIGAFEPFYFRIFTMDRERFRRVLTELPYKKLPGLRELLLDVRARTRKDDVIAIYGPFPRWDDGYDYLYARSLYILAGRRIVGLLDSRNRPHPEALNAATYVAAYRAVPAIPHFRVIWRGDDGVLMRREP